MPAHTECPTNAKPRGMIPEAVTTVTLARDRGHSLAGSNSLSLDSRVLESELQTINESLPHWRLKMSEKIKAIDFMYYVATREFMEQWDRAKEGELICRMEKAIGGPPRFASIDEMLRQMDDAGVEKAFITQCKMWSY